MGTTSIQAPLRRLAVAALALAATLAFEPARAPAFDVADNFNDNAVNKAIWGGDLRDHNGVLTEKNGRLEYTVTTPTNNDWRLRKLKWGTGPYDANWSARIEVYNAAAPKGDEKGAAFGISIIKCDHSEDELYVEGIAYRDGTTLEKGFYTELWSNDSYAGDAYAVLFTGSAALRGSVEISFDAATKILTAAYDTGTASDTATFDIAGGGGGGTGNGDWGMTDADRFCIGVYGWSSANAIASGKVSGDNFSATGLVPTKVLVVAPNGREKIPSGGSYEIQWFKPDNVDSVKLDLSCDKGATWTPIDPAFLPGTTYKWTVPTPAKNLTGCLVRATAYDAAHVKKGSDQSDRTFTIEVVRVTAPNAGVLPLVGGTTYDITWTTNATVSPVQPHIVLTYTLDGGTTWKTINTSGDPMDDGAFSWTVPGVGSPKTKCKVKLVLKDGDGATVGSDTSNGFFTIVPAP